MGDDNAFMSFIIYTIYMYQLSGPVSAKVRHIGEALIVSDIPEEIKKRVEDLQKRLNEDDSAWDELRNEENSVVLATLIWEWLDQLKVCDHCTMMQHCNLLAR